MTAPSATLTPTAVVTSAAVAQSVVAMDRVLSSATLGVLREINALDLQAMASADMARVLFPLVQDHRADAVVVAGRLITDLAPTFRPFLPPASFYTQRMLAVGIAAVLAAQTPTLIRLAQRVNRHVYQAHRQRVIDHAERDRTAEAWARISGTGAGCGFCVMLISRGPVYRAERQGAFLSHDRCRCSAVPVYDTTEDWPGRDEYAQAERMYVAASRRAAEKGTTVLVELRKTMGNH